jgi:hypothetical protein
VQAATREFNAMCFGMAVTELLNPTQLGPDPQRAWCAAFQTLINGFRAPAYFAAGSQRSKRALGHEDTAQPANVTTTATRQVASDAIPAEAGEGRIRPTHSPRSTADGLMNRSLSRGKPVTQSSVTGSDLRCVAGVGFEPT